MSAVEAIGIRALQQHASEAVRRAEEGAVIGITHRGRLVAHLVPVARDGLAGLIAAGLARPARISVDDLPPPLASSGRSITAILDEQREHER